LHAFLLAVVTERALPGPDVAFETLDDAERTAGDAVAAAIANVGLHIDRIELGANDGSGGTCVQASGARAVLAHVRHHEPGEVSLGKGHGTLDEGDVTPGRRAQGAGIVVGHAGEVEAIVGELVPLLAGDLAGFAADADGGVGEESFGHQRRRPALILPVKAFDSWIETFGSATNEMRSFAESPRTRPLLPQ